MRSTASLFSSDPSSTWVGVGELKATEMKVGLLMNFGKQKLEFKRFIY